MAKLGCTVDEETDGILYVDAPTGKIFAEGSHVLCYHYNFPGDRASWKPKVYADAIADLKNGLEDCDDPNCDRCHEE